MLHALMKIRELDSASPDLTNAQNEEIPGQARHDY
jgi:hypothetical protein